MLNYVKLHYYALIICAMALLFVCATIYRFNIQQNYLVAFESDCDPETQSCFVYCENDDCNDPFFYSVIEREAAQLHEMCGADVTVCDAAYSCNNDTTCKNLFCDPSTDGVGQCDDINN